MNLSRGDCLQGSHLKEQCHEIFCFGFFSFVENSRRYSQVKVHHRYQRHRWQIIVIISDCLHLKVNLKEKMYLNVNSTTQRCPPKALKLFWSKVFFTFATGVSDTGGAPCTANISRFFEKILNGTNGIFRGLGETDSWKKTCRRKSRDTVPLSRRHLIASVRIAPQEQIVGQWE